MSKETSINTELIVTAHLPTKWGEFDILAYRNADEVDHPHLVLRHKEYDHSAPVHVRIHSECITGDVFGSSRCDCGEQLHHSLAIIGKAKGILIYLRQEGRGIGIVNKLRSYNLQDLGIDTIDANTHLGFEPDERDFKIGVDILNDLGVSKIIIITNNPDKINIFKQTRIEVIDRMPIIIPTNTDNAAYIQTKRDKMGHLL